MGQLLSPEGDIVEVPDAKIDAYVSQGFKPVSHEAVRSDLEQKAMDARANERGVVGTINAGLTNAASGLTLGASDVALRGLLSEGEMDRLRAEEGAHPIASTVGKVAGAVVGSLADPATLLGKSPAALATRAGQAISKVGEGTSALASVGRAVAGGAVEGGLQGLGQGVSELAMSDDPLTMERAASVLSSNALFGGVVGGAVGGLGRIAEKGLTKAKTVLDEHIANSIKAGDIPEDLAALDAKGLREAKVAELDNIEAGRVPQRQQVADDIKAFREDLKDQKLWLATKGSEDSSIRIIGKQSLKADRQLDNILDNPIALAEKPQYALTALQKQQYALEQLSEAAPKIRASVEAERAAAEAAGSSSSAGEVAGAAPKIEPSARLAALDNVPAAVERNKALQSKIRELIAEPKSARLDSIAAADDLMKSGGKAPTIGAKIAGGAAYGAAAGAVAHIPFIGPFLAPLAGGKASDVVGKVLGKFGKATTEAAKRTSAAVGKFLEVAPKVGAPIVTAAPVLATKVLASVRYAPPADKTDQEQAHAPAPKLAESFLSRSREIRSQVAPDETGTLRMRPEARQALADRISPLAAHNPLVADKLETNAVRRLEFLASKLPKRPDLVTPPGGKDTWQPSDMEMRAFARYVSAVEDPGGVEERLAHGTITPEDAEAYQAVYPERAQHLKQTIMEQLPQLRVTLPYIKRLAYSIFSGQPVDPAMDPQILTVLQSQFLNEEGSEGGTAAPKAKPNFGSLGTMSKPEFSPAQKRSG